MFGHQHGRGPREEESSCLSNVSNVRDDYLSPSLFRLTSFNKIARSNQTSVAGTDNNCLPDIAIISLSNVAFRLDNTIGMETTDQTFLLGVNVALAREVGVVRGHGGCA